MVGAPSSSHASRGLLHGLGFGLAYALAEPLLTYVPSALHTHIQSPLPVILKAIAFDLALGALLGLVCTPLLARRRGGALHALAMVVLLGGVAFAVSPAFRTARLFNAATVALALVLFASALAAGARPRLARVRLPLAAALLAAVFGVPALLTPRGPALPRAKRAPPAGAPNLLLIVIDTVRADHLDLFGYRRETAPVLSRFAREGAVFDRAISPATWTLPSHASMFTGLYPSAHGAHHEGNHLSASNTTLAEILHAGGWITVGFNANPWLTESNGMAQGFDRLEPSWLSMTAPMTFLAYRIGARLGLVSPDHGAQEVTDRFTAWVASAWDGRHPFFAFLNYIEPHFPYEAFPPEARGLFLPPGTGVDAMRRASGRALGAQLFGDPVAAGDAAIIRDLYDAAIRYEDALIARSLDALRARGALDRTVVIIVSDHGELFGEHGLYGHELSLSERLLRVPLVIRFPPRVPEGLRIQTPVSTVAIFPTALDLLGLPPREGVQARSLGPLLRGEKRATTAPLLSEQHKFEGLIPGTYHEHGGFDRLGVRYRAFEEDGWKLVEDARGHRWLFRPADDPEEIHDSAAARPDVEARLAASRDVVVRGLGLGALDAPRLGPGGNVPLDPAARERLKALGYVQ